MAIDVTAHYLDYNTVTTSLSFDIYKDKEITFSIENNPSYVVSSDGFASLENIRIKAKIDGSEFSQEQWDALSVPQIQVIDDKMDFKIELSDIEKSNEIGIFELRPSFPNGKPSTGTYCDVNYRIVYQQQFGSETWQGETESILKLTDERSWWERNWDLAVKLAISLAVIFVLLGYLPFIKHYLPKSLKKKPYIKCRTTLRFYQMPRPLPLPLETDAYMLTQLCLSRLKIPLIYSACTVGFVPSGWRRRGGRGRLHCPNRHR